MNVCPVQQRKGTFRTATTNNGNPSQVTIGGGGSSFTQTFGYDNLNRRRTFADNGGSGISQTLDHDRYGNMWQSSASGLSSVAAMAAMPTTQSNYCGPGGAGPTGGIVNGACAAHDVCYGRAGINADGN